MIATLTFNIPEEQEEFNLACNASMLSAKLDDIKEDVRKIYKYREFKTSEARELINEIYNSIILISQE